MIFKCKDRQVKLLTSIKGNHNTVI